MKKLIPILIFLSFCGCEVVPFVGPLVSGVIYWNDGQAHKYYDHDSETVHRAVKRVCRDLKYEISRDEPQDGNFYLIAGSGDQFKINIEQVEADISKLSVRVNILGDKPYVELLYKKVDEQLDVIEFDQNGNPVIKRNRRQHEF